MVRGARSRAVGRACPLVESISNRRQKYTRSCRCRDRTGQQLWNTRVTAVERGGRSEVLVDGRAVQIDSGEETSRARVRNASAFKAVSVAISLPLPTGPAETDMSAPSASLPRRIFRSPWSLATSMIRSTDSTPICGPRLAPEIVSDFLEHLLTPRALNPWRLLPSYVGHEPANGSLKRSLPPRRRGRPGTPGVTAPCAGQSRRLRARADCS
jgi:hypothetical protein